MTPSRFVVSVRPVVASRLRSLARRYRVTVEELLVTAVEELVAVEPVVVASVEDVPARPPLPRPIEEYESVWNGGEGLTSYQQGGKR